MKRQALSGLPTSREVHTSWYNSAGECKRVHSKRELSLAQISRRSRSDLALVQPAIGVRLRRAGSDEYGREERRAACDALRPDGFAQKGK